MYDYLNDEEDPNGTNLDDLTQQAIKAYMAQQGGPGAPSQMGGQRPTGYPDPGKRPPVDMGGLQNLRRRQQAPEGGAMGTMPRPATDREIQMRALRSMFPKA